MIMCVQCGTADAVFATVATFDAEEYNGNLVGSVTCAADGVWTGQSLKKKGSVIVKQAFCPATCQSHTRHALPSDKILFSRL